MEACHPRHALDELHGAGGLVEVHPQRDADGQRREREQQREPFGGVRIAIAGDEHGHATRNRQPDEEREQGPVGKHGVGGGLVYCSKAKVPSMTIKPRIIMKA